MKIENEILPGKYKDIKNYESFVKAKPVDKGFSGEEKYYIEAAGGKQLLLRVANADAYEYKKNMFNMMRSAAALNIPMPIPVDFGMCNSNKNVYMLLSWHEGEDLEKLMPSLSETTRYELGLKAGEILRKIHSVPMQERPKDWYSEYIKGAHEQIQEFNATGVQIDGSDMIARYFEKNKHLINDRPLSFRHGDYFTANLIVSENNDLYAIDWDMYDCGDPWGEFSAAINNADLFPHYMTGLIRGYFGGEPPAEFWTILSLYSSIGSFVAVCWAVYTNQPQEALNSCVENVKNTLLWFDNMRNPVPTWYLKNYNAL